MSGNPDLLKKLCNINSSKVKIQILTGIGYTVALSLDIVHILQHSAPFSQYQTFSKEGQTLNFNSSYEVSTHLDFTLPYYF